jgi:hypothetical protein
MRVALPLGLRGPPLILRAMTRDEHSVQPNCCQKAHLERPRKRRVRAKSAQLVYKGSAWESESGEKAHRSATPGMKRMPLLTNSEGQKREEDVQQVITEDDFGNFPSPIALTNFAKKWDNAGRRDTTHDYYEHVTARKPQGGVCRCPGRRVPYVERYVPAKIWQLYPQSMLSLNTGWRLIRKGMYSWQNNL